MSSKKRTKKQIFAASVMAIQVVNGVGEIPGNMRVRHACLVFSARNEKKANEYAVEYMEQEWPVFQGWTEHSAHVTKVGSAKGGG